MQPIKPSEFVVRTLNTKIGESLKILQETPNQIPPRTGDYVEALRMLKAEMDSLNIQEGEIHSGWKSMQLSAKYSEEVFVLLAKELAEITGIPFFMVVSFDFAINDDPSQMTWFVSGIKPPFSVDEHGNIVTTYIGTILSYGGVREKWWSLGDVDIPPHEIPPSKRIGGFSVSIVGDEYEFTENME